MMCDWKIVLVKARIAALAMVGWLAVYGTALAQAGIAKKEDNGGGSYVLPYAIVMLGVGLGMLFVCRSSNRRERAKPEQYEAAKITEK